MQISYEHCDLVNSKFHLLSSKDPPLSPNNNQNIRALFADSSSELTGVTHEEGDHCECHQRRIEDVYGPFNTQKIAITAHSILNNTENIPDHDESGRQVKHSQCRLPRNAVCFVNSGVAPEFDIEQQGSDDEKAENDDLEDQPADNYVPTKLRVHSAVAHASLDP